MTHRSGRGRESKSCAVWSKAKGVGVLVAAGKLVRELDVEADELVGRLVGERVDALVAHLHEVAALRALEGDTARGGEGLVAVCRGG